MITLRGVGALLAAVAVGYMMLVGAARLLLVRGNVETKLAIVMFAAASVIGDPHVRARLNTRIPGGSPLLMEIGQSVSLLATAAVAAAFVAGIESPGHQDRSWLGRSVAYWRRVGPILALSALGCIALLLLSASALRQGLLYYQLPGWQAGAHALIFWLVPTACVALIIRQLMDRHRRLTSRVDRTFSWSVLLIVAAQLLDRGAACVGVACYAQGFRSLMPFVRTVDSAMLWLDLAAVTALLPSVVWAVAALLRLDADSREIRRLLPVWSDLSAAVPGVVCAPLLSRGNAPSERRTRLRVEIRDAVTVVARFVLPLPMAVDDLIDDAVDDVDVENLRAVAELVAAVRRIEAAGGVERMAPTQEWTVEPSVELLVRWWAPAARLLESAGPELVTA